VTTADFAAFSDNAIMFASIVYVLAFLAHLAEWVSLRSTPYAAPVEARESVSVGSSSTDLSALDAAGTAHTPDKSAERELRVEKLGRIGLALTVLGCVLHLLGLVARGLGSDPARVPWGNMYEFTLAGTFGVAVMYLVLMRRHHLRWMGVLVTGFLVVVLMLDVLVLYVPAGPLVPALHSYWLVIHVSAAAISGGAFTVGGLVSVLYLVKARAERRVLAGGTMSASLRRLPSAEAMDGTAYKVLAFAFPLWTFGVLVAGPIWAEHAWGRYWGWDPKEIWSLVTWVVYAAYLHARATAGWRGRRAATIAIVGWFVFIFNFVGVNLLVSGLHSYAGV
jgi:cytochrome c-type biogenesis protein CcsB